MTIAMIGHKGLPARSGGIERHVESLAMGLVSRGYRVVSFGRAWYVGKTKSPKDVEQVLTQGIHTKHLDALTHGLTALWAARSYHPDVVHLHGVGIALLAPIARLLLPVSRLVITFHCMDRRFSKWGWFARTAFLVGEWFAALFAHELITVSQELAAYCAKTYGRRATYIPHAFATQPLAMPKDRREELVRAEGHAPQGYLLFVGRLLPHKGAHRLIQAYAELQKHFPTYAAQVDLVIVGGTSFTDAYAKEVRLLAQRTPGVHMLGERHGETLQAIQSSALAHVFPSTEEGLSLAVLEGAYSGRPVLTHALEANREATGGYALEVDATSIPALTGGLLGLLMLSEEAQIAQGRALQGFVQRAFHARMATDRLDRLYRSVCAQEDMLVTPIVA